MSYQPENINGQATMANSEPVVIASNQSNVPVAIFDTQIGQGAMTTPLRDLQVAIKVRLFGDAFQNGVGIGDDAGTFPPAATVTGTALGSVTDGAFVYTTGATGGATGNMTSNRRLSFLSGTVGVFQGGFLLPTANLTSFNVVSRRLGVDTVVDSGVFNVVTGTAPISGTFQRFEIYYQANAAIFSFGGVVIHRMPGTLPNTRTVTLDEPISFTWTNAATPTAQIRWGMFDANNGLFFEANYSIANVTGQVRGVACLRTGATVVTLAKRTYMASGAFVPAANSTDLIIVGGSATQIVRVLEMSIGTTNTAAGSQTFFLVKRSTVSTAPTAATRVPLDSASVAATAVVGHYTTVPASLGTAVGTLVTKRVASTVLVPATFASIQFDTAVNMLDGLNKPGGAQDVVLRGTGEQLAVNFNAAALVGGQIHTYSILWTEE